MPMDNVTLENTQQSISSRDAKSVASVMVNGKWINLSDTLEQTNVKSDVGAVSKQVAEQQTVITSTVAQADSAVAYANDAVEKSRVNSQAIVDINSAVSEAVSDAAVARSNGLRAWNAAQSNVDLIDLNYASASAEISGARTEAIAAADEAKASASAAQADIVAVRSDVAAVQADVTTNKSDVAAAKSDIAIAKTDLASQATSLSSYVAQASAAGEDITTLKSQAGHFEQEMADTKGDVSQLKISASSASAALSDAAGNISSLQVSAKSYSAALSDTKGDIATVKATASELETKYADAAGDISQIKTDAKGMTQTISDAQGDIAKLKTRADGFDTQFADTNGNINKLQTDATGTKQTLTNAKSDIAVLQSRADGFDTKYADAAGNINTLKANASGFSQTLTNAQGDISTLKSTVSGVQTTLTNAQGDISTLQSDVSGLKKTTSDNAGNISTLQSTANTLTSQMSSAQGDISTLKQTASGISSQVSGMSSDLNNLKSQAQWVIVTDTVDLNNIKTPCHEFLKGGVTNAPNETAWWYLTVEGSESDRITQTVIADQSNNRYTRRFADSWSAWVKVANQNDIDTLNGKITANTTAINQNKNAITLKADQTAVDKINGTVSQLQSSLTVQAGQIQEKVTSSQVTGMLTGYATKDYTQSLVSQKADQWNLNLTSLQTDVNAIKTTGGGVNLVAGTIEDIVVDDSGNTGTQGWHYELLPINANLKVGDKITVSAESVTITGRGDLSKWGATLYSTDIGEGRADNYEVNAGNNSKVTITVASINDASKQTALLIYSGRMSDTEGKKAVFHHLMVEEGTVAHTWSPAPSDMATVTSVTNLSATVDGIKSQVYNSDGSSRITQLSNLIQDKVSSGDFTSATTQLKNLINQRVQVGDVISQINQEAGGNTLIQVSNGKGSLILNAANTVITGKAWIPVAAIADLTADQIQAGTLKGVKVDFRDSTGTGMIADGSTLTFDVSNTPAGYLTYNGMPIAELPDGSGGNELAIRYRLSTSIIPDDNSGAQATFSKAAQKIAYMTGTNQGKQMLSGLEVHSNNHHWLCAVNSDATCNRFEVNDRDGLNIAWHDNTHLWISDGKAKLYKDNNDSQTATELEVHGWEWVNGWVEAAGHSTHSALSTKTDIQPVDNDKMLKMVNDTDLTTYLYKTDVASGETHRHIGLIIDDVHDVAQYQAPQDFIAPNGVSRDDDNMIGALFGAVKALTKRIKTLESKVG